MVLGTPAFPCGITGLIVAVSWWALIQPTTDCLPSELLFGYCDPPSAGVLVRMLAIEAAIAFFLVMAAALAIRAVTRAVVRWRRRDTRVPPALTLEAAPSRDADARGSGWWRLNRRRVGPAALALALFGAGVGADRSGLIGGPADAADYGLIRQAWDLLHARYAFRAELNSNDLAYAAINAMTEAVGDSGHTGFLTRDEAAALGEDLAGSYVGVGLTLEESGDSPVISSVVADGPAARAGVRAGDRLLAIDGDSTVGMTDEVLTQDLRGPDGTEVGVTIGRSGFDESIAITITRGEVLVPAVDWAMVPGTPYALVGLTAFSDGAADALEVALHAVRAAGATGIVLDLRGNPGGLINEAVDIASEFLASGVVAQARDASGVIRTVSVDREVVDATTPMMVLIDADSASASEMVAGALQDAGRARVVGETTAGLGTGVAPFRLDDGSYLMVGIVEWLTRNGRSVWHTGVTPDARAAITSGATPLGPSDLAALGVGGLQSSGDTQLAMAVQLLHVSAP